MLMAEAVKARGNSFDNVSSFENLQHNTMNDVCAANRITKI
jgi:hypothetical protein